MSHPSTYQSELDQRAAVVAEALSWQGTPYHSCADVKGAGVDCGMLLVRAFVDTGVIEPFDPRPYAEQWHVNQREERYLGWILNFGVEIPNGANDPPPQPGDVVVFKWGHVFSHGGIVVQWPVIIHAVRPCPAMLDDVEKNLKLAKLERRFFSRWAAAR